MKILIADDHNLFLKGLEFVLQSNFQQATIKTASDYTGLFALLKTETDASLIITDLAMPGSNSLSGIEEIRRLAADTPVIILSAVFDKKVIQKTLDLGVAGYIPKASPNNEIIEAINTVLAGGIYVPSELLKKNEEIFQSLIEIDNDDNAIDKNNFAPRQKDILQLIVSGLSNKQIAYELNLSEGTVKFYITAILKKLNVYNRTAAGLKALELGIITKQK